MLYASLGNELVPQLLGAFWTVFRRVAGARGWTDDPDPTLTVHRHRDIVTALRARDVEGAQRAMADHFRGIEARAAQESRGWGEVLRGGSTTGSVKPARFSRAGRVPGSRVFIVSRKCNTRQREPGWLSLPANTPPGRSTRDALSVEQPIRCSSHRASCAPASSFTAAFHRVIGVMPTRYFPRRRRYVPY